MAIAASAPPRTLFRSLSSAAPVTTRERKSTLSAGFTSLSQKMGMPEPSMAQPELNILTLVAACCSNRTKMNAIRSFSSGPQFLPLLVEVPEKKLPSCSNRHSEQHHPSPREESALPKQHIIRSFAVVGTL